MRRSGAYRFISIDDPARYTPEQLKAGLNAVGENFHYVEPGSHRGYEGSAIPDESNEPQKGEKAIPPGFTGIAANGVRYVDEECPRRARKSRRFSKRTALDLRKKNRKTQVKAARKKMVHHPLSRLEEANQNHLRQPLFIPKHWPQQNDWTDTATHLSPETRELYTQTMAQSLSKMTSECRKQALAELNIAHGGSRGRCQVSC